MESNLVVFSNLGKEGVSFERKLTIVQEIDTLILSFLLINHSNVQINFAVKKRLQSFIEFDKCSNHIRKLQNWRTFILKVQLGERNKDGKRGRSYLKGTKNQDGDRGRSEKGNDILQPLIEQDKRTKLPMLFLPSWGDIIC